MAFGISLTANDYNARWGGTFRQLNQLMYQITIDKKQLDTQTVGNLNVAGMASGDATLLKSAAADAANLAQIYFGLQFLPGAATSGQAVPSPVGAVSGSFGYDFTTFLKQGYGFGD